MELIEYEKNPENLMQYHEIHEQIISTLVFKANTYRCKVKDAYNDILYILNIHTTPISTRFSIGLRFTGINKHLLRLDFGDTLRHTNNRGEADEYIVYGSHAHFNSSDDKYSNKNVIPIDKLSEFKNLKLLINSISFIFIFYYIFIIYHSLLFPIYILSFCLFLFGFFFV